MLAVRIAQLRKKHGMSQLELAGVLHISPSAEGLYEQGRRTPSLEILVEVEKANAIFPKCQIDIEQRYIHHTVAVIIVAYSFKSRDRSGVSRHVAVGGRALDLVRTRVKNI